MQDFASFSFDFSNEIETEFDSTLQPKINLVKKLLAQPQELSEQEHTIDVLKGYIDESILALLVQIDYEIWIESATSFDRLITKITQNIRQVELANKTQILLNIPTTFATKDLKNFLKLININLGESSRYISAGLKQSYFYNQDHHVSVVNYCGQRIQFGQQDMSKIELADINNDYNNLISEVFVGSSEWPWHNLSLTVQHQNNLQIHRGSNQAQIVVMSYHSMNDLTDLFALINNNLLSETYIVLWVSEQFNREQQEVMMKVLDSHASKFGGVSLFQQNLKTLYGKNLWEWLNTYNHFFIDYSAEKLKFFLIQLKAKVQKKLEQHQDEIQLYSKICLNDDAFSKYEISLSQEILKELRTNFQTSKALIEQFTVNVDEVSHLLEKILPEVDFDNAEQKQKFEYQKAQMLLESGFYTEALQYFKTLYRQGMDVISDIIFILANHFDDLNSVSLVERFEWIQVAIQHSPNNSYFHELLGLCYEHGIGCMQDFTLAFKEYQTASKHDSVYALNKLGECYLFGKGTAENDEKAFECFKKASETDIDAKFNLGRCYLWGWGTNENKSKGVQYLTAAAEQNDAGAQNLLADCYLYGWGISNSDEQAFAWYIKAAEQDHLAAQNSVGWCYLNGRGVKEDEVKAYNWFKKSADKNNTDAQNWLGKCFRHGWGIEQNDDEAFNWYMKAAEQNHSDAQNSVGFCYLNGCGVKESESKAYQWFKKSAVQNNTDAQNWLGKCFRHGWGIEQNDYEAFEWFKKSAVQNNADAQDWLGRCYHFGWGIAKNDDEAFNWYMKAAEQNHSDAQNSVGFCYLNGCGVKESESKAYQWFKNSAAQNNAYAQNWLGWCYSNAKGTVQSDVKAFEWFQKSAEQNVDTAQYNVGWCYYNGRGVGTDIKEAKKWLLLAADQGNEDAKTLLQNL